MLGSLYREVVRNHRLAHEDAECEGADYETQEQREDRLYRERTEELLVASAEAVDARTARWDAEDRRWREAHPIKPTEESLAAARKYIADLKKERGWSK